MSSNIQNIKENNNIYQKQNGAEGGISDKTYQPIKIHDWGLNQLHYGDFDVNLLSCMILELEHLHSAIDHKQDF